MALSSCISLSNQTAPFNIDETGTHGTPEFPVAIYRDDVTENFVNWHWHAEFFSKLDHIIRNAWEIIRNEPEDYEIRVRNLLSDFFAVLSHVNRTDSMTSSSANLLLEDRVQIILNYIHANYSKNITLDDLANVSNVSKSEVLRCFKSIINISPIKYLKNFRLQTAAYMLKNSVYSIQTIYELCGFDSNSYFSKSFKEIYHCSPREYRER